MSKAIGALALAVALHAASGQVRTIPLSAQAERTRLVMNEPGEPQNNKDPGYPLYREGYHLILEERWEDARRLFAELQKKFPRSEYLDDARFWSAYSWKTTDRKKAVAAYTAFLKEFPGSNYYDDALADLQRLGAARDALAPRTPGSGPEAVVRIAEIEEQLAHLQERIARIAAAPLPPQIPRVPPAGSDPRIRIRIEALNALGRSPRDAKAFQALKETALDTAQPPEVRQAALEGVKLHRGPEAGVVLLSVALDKADPRLRQSALYGLQGILHGDDPSAGVIRGIALDRTESPEIREGALQLLAVSDRQAFPSVILQIAKQNEDPRMQRASIYYMSRFQDRDAEAVSATLRLMARDRERAAEIRESALFALQQLNGVEEAPFMAEVAKEDPEYRLRQAAVFSLGATARQQPGIATHTFQDIITDRQQPQIVRQAAMSQLMMLGDENSLGFISTLAVEDPDEGIQDAAIHFVAQMSSKKNQSLETLTKLYPRIPPGRLPSRDVLLYSVASIGTDEAVNFLIDVARNDPNDLLRQRAVYYLGNVGSEKARAALVEIVGRK